MAPSFVFQGAVPVYRKEANQSKLIYVRLRAEFIVYELIPRDKFGTFVCLLLAWPLLLLVSRVVLYVYVCRFRRFHFIIVF